MKIRVVKKSYEKVAAKPKMKHRTPGKQSAFLRFLIRRIAGSELKKVHFTHTEEGMEKIGEKEPCLYLMNHSSFTDLYIAFKLIGKKPFHIICTSDGFVGKERLMRKIGCIPTWKFQTDVGLVKDMLHVSRKLGSSILMYPEASYSFDGTETPLPESLGKCIRLLKLPVVMIRTEGAYLRDPLYNGLRLRKVNVSAKMSCLLTKEEAAAMKPEAINEVLGKAFTYDHFRTQQEKKILVTEPFRAEGLERALYKCPFCYAEGKMMGRGSRIACENCGVVYELTETGYLNKVHDGQAVKQHMAGRSFHHIPDWYRFERQEVRRELEDGVFRMKLPVEICMMVDMKAIYEVGTGTLTISDQGFHLTGCEGKLDYLQPPHASYSLYSDFFWYEIGDMICIGSTACLYYCFPQEDRAPVAKARLAAEELYKIHTEKGQENENKGNRNQKERQKV